MSANAIDMPVMWEVHVVHVDGECMGRYMLGDSPFWGKWEALTASERTGVMHTRVSWDLLLYRSKAVFRPSSQSLIH